MIDTLNTALLELQSALTARALYPPSHPRISKGEQRAFALFERVLRADPVASIFVVGERVIFGNQALPSSATLAAILFRRLQEKGVDRLTFRRGLFAPEIRTLLDWLAEPDPTVTMPAATHVGLGFIQDREHESPEQAMVPAPGQPPLPSDIVNAVGDTWKSVHEGRKLAGDLLGDVMLTISRSLRDSSAAMLPLASVKRHDEYTFVHTINVAMLSTSLSEAIGFDERMTHEVNMAALLHDVGKELIPHDLLNKSGRFTDDEFRIVQRHPVDGARILLSTPGVPELAPIVAYEHHVRADGSGYPRVPRGWKLSLASRIVQVADVFDALRTHRPYRPAVPLSKIVEIMTQDVGVLFDADLLDVFFRKVVSRGVPEPAPLDPIAATGTTGEAR